jgi:hypothetical protein
VTIDPQQRFFFVHVMKTGGTTFGTHIARNFRADEIYPDRTVDRDLRVAYTQIGHLTSLPEERRRRIRVYRGHFPFVATTLLSRRSSATTRRRCSR